MNQDSLNYYQPSIDYILEVQEADGSIAWERGRKLDPWDHVEAAMGLSIGGKREEAEKAYFWLAKVQEPDGSWFAEYKNSLPVTKRKETNFIAYISTGALHHYLIYKDKNFLKTIFPAINKSVDFVLSMQTDQGDICWASEEGKSDLDDSLITGSSSIYKSLECAESIFNLLNEEHGHLKEAKELLKNSIINKPERYDRTWESKSRYSMDWYYPILCGLLDREAAKKRIEKKWDEFIVEGMGCKCVSEEPWVTIAESCELVMALMKIGLEDKAKSLFDCLHQWKDEDDGLYWTGYVYTDKKYWPVEKPTWTAGAVLLAADSLYKFTEGSELFLVDLT